MEKDLSTLTLEELSVMHEKATQEMQAALLDGASWEALRNKRVLVTQLSIQIAKKKMEQGLVNPAGTSFKTEKE
jgi:hypothetical protein